MRFYLVSSRPMTILKCLGLSVLLIANPEPKTSLPLEVENVFLWDIRMVRKIGKFMIWRPEKFSLVVMWFFTRPYSLFRRRIMGNRKSKTWLGIIKLVKMTHAWLIGGIMKNHMMFVGPLILLERGEHIAKGEWYRIGSWPQVNSRPPEKTTSIGPELVLGPPMSLKPSPCYLQLGRLI